MDNEYTGKRPTWSAGPIDLALIMRHVRMTLEFYEEKQQHRVSIRYEPSDMSLLVRDPDRVIQALVTLIPNAYEHSDDGGEVVVKAGRRGETACIRVEDYGMGVPSHMRIALFESLARVDDDPDRAAKPGLALRLARQAVESQGGTIGIEEVSPIGTCIWFTLPALGGGGPARRWG